MSTPEGHAAHGAEAEAQIRHDVAEYGLHVGIITGDGYSPGFAYTIGLYKTYGYPELICFSLNQDVLHSVLWSGKELLDQQNPPDLGSGHPDFLEGYDVRLLKVDPNRYSDHLGYAGWFYDGWDFPVLQIVWPDKQALFPWQDGFNPDWQFKQPLLDRDADFKFREERNTAAFITRQVLEGLPILRVSHDADGDWQFLCDTTSDIADLKIVGLEEVTKIDPSVNALFQLNYGWSAWRETPEDAWETWEKEDQEEE